MRRDCLFRLGAGLLRARLRVDGDAPSQSSLPTVYRLQDPPGLRACPVRQEDIATPGVRARRTILAAISERGGTLDGRASLGDRSGARIQRVIRRVPPTDGHSKLRVAIEAASPGTGNELRVAHEGDAGTFNRANSNVNALNDFAGAAGIALHLQKALSRKPHGTDEGVLQAALQVLPLKVLHGQYRRTFGAAEAELDTIAGSTRQGGYTQAKKIEGGGHRGFREACRVHLTFRWRHHGAADGCRDALE
eukprot:scaffold4700_cov271-Pinguiococcus_pyrenoidosus.AAC.6